MNNAIITTNHFIVEWGGSRIDVTEVTGLSAEVETIEYREGSSRDNAPDIIPGYKKINNIILKRGIIKGDNQFFEWINTISHNTADRRDITISLLNELHEPVVVWKFKNAFPVKITWSDLKASSNETAIETIEIAHEGLTVLNE